MFGPKSGERNTKSSFFSSMIFFGNDKQEPEADKIPIIGAVVTGTPQDLEKSKPIDKDHLLLRLDPSQAINNLLHEHQRAVREALKDCSYSNANGYSSIKFSEDLFNSSKCIFTSISWLLKCKREGRG